ncbi:MAG TPA: aminotransferase class V-fold PLP-dependent enzyme [Candidatus Acidoferrales bacterium]|nr:aminotransferase class V-fold PLP-dependent enzyme [Candidatus Acidoferrales bacterium]
MPPLPRSQFAVTEHYAYLNHAATGVLPQRTHDALGAFLAAQANGGIAGIARYEAQVKSYREHIGRFIGAGGGEIAILRNTTDGATLVAQGIDWKPGDRVILSDNEFPANAIPWLALRRLGVEVDLVDTRRERMTPDVLRAAITGRTRVVAVSWVSFEDGYRHDLAALAEVAHANGALFCVDAIQGLGAFPLDVRALDIDVLFSGGQKWLLALQGVSFVYVREALLDRLRVGAPGWRSVSNIWEFLDYEQPLAPDATRFEGGTLNFIGALSLDESLSVLEGAGTDAIGAHILSLTDHLVEGLRACGANVRSLRGAGVSSGIVTFTVSGIDSIALGRALQSEGVVTTWRASGIRVSPHGYNTHDEIDALLRGVSALARTHTGDAARRRDLHV